MTDAQPSLLVSPRPPAVAGVDLRCCSVDVLLAEVRGASLVVADPPWTYSAGVPGHGRMGDHYEGLAIKAISHHLDRAWDCAGDDAYLLLWATWPILMDPGGFPLHDWGRWEGVTGGAWMKTGRVGTGYHWRGQTEPLLIYRKGSPKPHAMALSGHITDRTYTGAGNSGTRHSEKPLPWARDHVRAFAPPGGLVFDLYAGMAPYARACAAEGRRYVGAEIDPQRHADALGLLAGRVGCAP
jgi:hypothetical protein